MFEQLEIRCPKLGNQVTFAYCLKEGGDIPCPRTIKCWQSFFPVEDYIRKRLTPEDWERCFNQKPKEKILTLVELIEAAKKQTVK
ncbi:MAG: hypothetical protein DRH24_02720 [Deltaproteobacteria bacterium]|nr:MAG: hypothetical protein DRH24_02720 [Deltaproteobacteria bacterium]